ncbi:MAG: SsrA-binding protein, partial [Bacteroidia bacterium]|nr:SsrA-binding protein [Bacteroidia bacterium]
MAHRNENISIKNRKATFEYELVERFVAGMLLVGTEIKSIRNGKANLTDSYCQFIFGELYVKNLHISEYEM